MTKEQEEKTIKYLEVLRKEYLEDAKRRKENGEVIGYGTMEDIDKLRALYIGFALEMLKEKDKEIKTLTQTNKSYKGIINKKDRQIDLIKEYAHQEIEHYTETIEDYIDDDKEGNKNYIKELKEKREHWKDIERILENKPEELYMNWWKYGLYE